MSVLVFVNHRARWFPEKVTRAQILERMGEPADFIITRARNNEPDEILPDYGEITLAASQYLFTFPRYVTGG
jgi:hypothetical protein